MQTKQRMKNIDNAIGWKEFLKSFDDFVYKNNFSFEQHQIILHSMNSMYFMGYPVEDESQNAEKG
jgi:hypothetical protein